MEMQNIPKFKTREQWLNAFIEKSRPIFREAGFQLPPKIRASVGFTSGGRRSKSIGECWSNTSSEDGHFEIFIRPSIDSEARIADVLTHEMVHAAVGIDAGHGPIFRRCALAVGLGGRSMRATVATEEFYRWALPVLKELGPIPYAVLHEGESTAKPKQKTNLLRMECSRCGWLARVTRKHIEPFARLECPVPSCDGALETDDI